MLILNNPLKSSYYYYYYLIFNIGHVVKVLDENSGSEFLISTLWLRRLITDVVSSPTFPSAETTAAAIMGICCLRTPGTVAAAVQ